MKQQDLLRHITGLLTESELLADFQAELMHQNAQLKARELGLAIKRKTQCELCGEKNILCLHKPIGDDRLWVCRACLTQSGQDSARTRKETQDEWMGREEAKK